MGFFFDERADGRQREALQVIFSGQAGGWPAGFAELIDDVRGVEFSQIDFEIAGDLARWRVEVPGKARGSAEALTGPTAPEGARVQVHNAPGAEVGPGQIATWATAEEDEVEAFGLSGAGPVDPVSTSRSTGPGRTAPEPTAGRGRHPAGPSLGDVLSRASAAWRCRPGEGGALRRPRWRASRPPPSPARR
jgi:hypothetical protein